MRWVLPIVALLATTASAEPLLEDPTGDLFSDGPAGRTPFPGAIQSLDLTGLSIEEAETQVTFTLSIAAAHTPDQGSHFGIGFQADDTEFQVFATVRPAVFNALGTVEPEAALLRRPAGSEVWGNGVGIPVDLAGAELRTTVDKALLTNSVGLPVGVGDQLVGFWASSLDYYHNIAIVGGMPPRGIVAVVQDHMPTDLVPTGDFTLALGPPDTRLAKLTSPRPLRWSNGEATSLVFDVSLTNLHGEDFEASLALDDVPLGWEVTILREGLRAQAGETVSTPVVVAIPFGHEHGRTYSFNVTAINLADEQALDALELGVHYVQNPQPAGHHPTLYLHSDNTAFDGCRDSQPFMSTLMEHPTETGCVLGPASYDSPVPVRGYSWAAPATYHWCASLESPLLLGLDFDHTAEGRFQATLSSTTPVAGTLTGRLIATATAGDDFVDSSRCSRTPVIVLGTAASAVVDLAGQDATQGIDVPLSSGLDDLPFSLGRRLVLELTLQTDAPNPPRSVDEPFILPGAILDLPLLEYREQPVVPEAGLQLQLSSPARLLRNPGDVGVFNLTLAGRSAAEFDLLGLNADLASLHSDGNDVQVVVQVPDDAVDGMLIDVIVKAHARDEFALARVVLEVDVDEDHPSDARWAMKEGGKQAPTSSLLVLFALALSLVRRRR